MQKQTPPEATKTVYPILRQIVNLIPPNVFHAAASATKDLSRVFTPWSHVVALIYQQLTKTESLNGVCDAARLHASQWQELRGAVPPRRNTFSNANQHRDPTMMETLYWRRSIVRLLEMYGTAGGWKSGGAKPKPLYLQGFLPFSLSPMGQHLAKS